MDLDLGQLEALAAAVTEGTFDAAAGALHVTPSAVSQRIKALESSVGRALLVRSKPVRPTASGETVLRAARQMRAIADDLAADLGDVALSTDGHSGSLRPPVIPLAANADSLETWLLSALEQVGGELIFDVFVNDEGETAEFLRQGEVMAAVTASSIPVPGCTVKRLGEMMYRPKATPAFVSRWFPDGVTPSALDAAPVVMFDRNDHMADRYLRRRVHRQIDPPRHYIPGSNAFYLTVCRGLGWGMIPDLQDDPQRSGLIEIDPQGAIAVTLYWQQWRLASKALSSVADAVQAAAAKMLTRP
jgi:LysR family transcriptional regulator, chromosome initiation inhibitor